MCRSNVGTYLYQPVLWHCLWTRMADAKEWKISEEWHHTCEPDLQIFLIHARLSLRRYLGQFYPRPCTMFGNSFLKDWSWLWFSAFWSAAGGACAFSMNRDVFRWWGIFCTFWTILAAQLAVTSMPCCHDILWKYQYDAIAVDGRRAAWASVFWAVEVWNDRRHELDLPGISWADVGIPEVRLTQNFAELGN